MASLGKGSVSTSDYEEIGSETTSDHEEIEIGDSSSDGEENVFVTSGLDDKTDEPSILNAIRNDHTYAKVDPQVQINRQCRYCGKQFTGKRNLKDSLRDHDKSCLFKPSPTDISCFEVSEVDKNETIVTVSYTHLTLPTKA